jgi:hypothetical protein
MVAAVRRVVMAVGGGGRSSSGLLAVSFLHQIVDGLLHVVHSGRNLVDCERLSGFSSENAAATLARSLLDTMVLAMFIIWLC